MLNTKRHLMAESSESIFCEYNIVFYTCILFYVVPEGEHYRYCLVQYYFKNGKEHPIAFAQHGNSRKTMQDYL